MHGKNLMQSALPKQKWTIVKHQRKSGPNFIANQASAVSTGDAQLLNNNMACSCIQHHEAPNIFQVNDGGLRTLSCRTIDSI